MKRIRVAVMGTRGFPGVQGGVESHCQNLYPLLAQRGCEVVVFTRSAYMPVRGTIEYRGVKLIPIPCPRSQFFETVTHTFCCVIACALMRPDIVHVHAIGPSIFVPLLRLLGLRVVMTNHGADYSRKKWGRFARWTLKTGEALGSRYANAIIAISKSVAGAVISTFCRPVTFIPNGVHVSLPSRESGELAAFGLEKGKYILAVGRFVPEKGFHDLIEAFRLFAVSHPDSDWKLAIVGQADHPNAYSGELEQKAAKVKNVVLTGFLGGETLRQVYSHAGLFVLPSYCEGLSIALLEAMGYGLPCIVSDIEANRDAGLAPERLFPPADPAALCAALTLHTGRTMAEDARRLQTEMVVREYNWETISRTTLEVYGACLDGGKRPMERRLRP